MSPDFVQYTYSFRILALFYYFWVHIVIMYVLIGKVRYEALSCNVHSFCLEGLIIIKNNLSEEGRTPGGNSTLERHNAKHGYETLHRNVRSYY
jgi:hypothetical protein